MLLVFTGQVMAENEFDMCDMDHSMMSHADMDMGQMNHDMTDMSEEAMDCCDDEALFCSMDCSYSITTILQNQSFVQAETLAASQILLPEEMMIARPTNTLYRPPISA